MLKAEEEKGFTRRSGLWWWSRFDGEAERAKAFGAIEGKAMMAFEWVAAAEGRRCFDGE